VLYQGFSGGMQLYVILLPYFHKTMKNNILTTNKGIKKVNIRRNFL
jgi:hypothetical protein